MTEKSNTRHEVSRREFMVAAGAAAAVGGSIGATATPAAAASPACHLGLESRGQR